MQELWLSVYLKTENKFQVNRHMKFEHYTVEK